MLHFFRSFHTFLDALIKQKNQWHSWGDKKVRIASAAMCHVSGLSLIFGAIMSMTAMDSRHFGMGSSCMLPLLSWIALRASGGGSLQGMLRYLSTYCTEKDTYYDILF